MLGLSGRHSAFLLALVSIAILSSNATAAILGAQGASFLIFSAACTLVTCIARVPRMGADRRGFISRLCREKWFLVAVVLKTVNDLAFYYAILSSREIEVTIIVYLYPVFNALVGAWLLGRQYQRLSRKEWLLFAMSFVSIVLLTPFADFVSISVIVFLMAGLSAMASIYVVLIQVVSDRIAAPAERERDILAVLFLGSLALHLGVIAGVAIFRPDLRGWLMTAAEDPVPFLLGATWIGVACYWLSEAFWLRASRLYEAISLKSLFYLSPVLGAVYLSVLGIDEIDEVVVFCLCGVVVSNYLLHQTQIDDLSFIAFLLSLTASAVVLRIAPADGVLSTFHLSPAMFQTQITFVSILGGFILFRAFEVFQRGADAFQAVVLQAVRSAASAPMTRTIDEKAFARLVREPDIALWSESDKAEESLRDILLSEPVRNAYLRYLKVRLMGLSRPERLLMYLVCLMAVPAILAQAVVAQSGGFTAAFAAGVFCFLPILVDEQVTFRMARPVTGIIVRRTMLVHSTGTDPEWWSPRSLYRTNERTRTFVFIALTLVICAASWALLQD